MLSQHLLALGLTPNQIKVYEYILDNSQVKATAIINHLSANRAVVYKTLDELIQKKLIAKVTKNKVAEYFVLCPTALQDNLSKQKEATKSALEIIKDKLDKSGQNNTDFFVYNGTSGVIEFFNFVAEVGQDWYVIGANFGMQQQEYQNYIPSLARKVKRKGLQTFILADQETQNLNWVPNSSITYLDKTVQPSSSVIHIFGNYVAHIVWKKPEFVFVFENKEVADDYRKYFSILTTK